MLSSKSGIIRETTIVDESKIYFYDLLRLIINTEMEMEIMRQNLQGKSSFSLHEAFQLLDISNKG
jgi:hypothetical protein